MNTEVKKSVYKDVDKLPISIKELVFEKITELENADNIHQVENVKPLEGTEEPYFRIKLRNYRLIIYYEKETKTAKVYALIHRKDSYKKENLPWKN